MDITTIIFLIFAVIIGVVIGYFVQQSKSSRLIVENNHLAEQLARNQDAENDLIQLKQQNAVLSSQIIGYEQKVSELKISITDFENSKHQNIQNLVVLKEEISMLKEKKSSLEEMLRAREEKEQKNEEKLKVTFENLANKIFEEKQSSFSQLGTQQIKTVLEPFGKDIADFKEKIEKIHISEAEKRASLSTELSNLMKLNQQLSSDATNLTKALKGEKNNKVQGNWGEMILETILQNSGLKKGVEYFPQDEQKSEEGRSLRPDIVVRYPDEREVIIDSKVSLTAYSRYVEAETEDIRAVALKEHIVSIRSHIDELSAKKYDSRENSLDFVMMFMPIEASYMIALNEDANLWEYAYKRRIILITPTHLITALKLVYDLWKREKQNQSVMQIVDRATKMYDKFDIFLGYMNSIDSNITKCRESYDSALKSLSQGNGNFIWQVQQLQSLGIKGTKAKSNIPVLEDTETINI